MLDLERFDGYFSSIEKNLKEISNKKTGFGAAITKLQRASSLAKTPEHHFYIAQWFLKLAKTAKAKHTDFGTATTRKFIEQAIIEAKKSDSPTMISKVQRTAKRMRILR